MECFGKMFKMKIREELKELRKELDETYNKKLDITSKYMDKRRPFLHKKMELGRQIHDIEQEAREKTEGLEEHIWNLKQEIQKKEEELSNIEIFKKPIRVKHL